MNDLYLIYVHEIGFDYKDKHFYEFIFSDTLENIDGEGWDSYPASGNPDPPKSNVVKQVGKIGSMYKLTVAQENEQFSMWDSIDGVIPLAWQNIDGLEQYPTDRLVFPFGMKIKDVEAILYEKDIIIEYEKILTDE
jgi:hypothetical protein